MSRTKTVTQISEIVKQAAPELRFVAAYNADDSQLSGSMQLYQKRCFVYLLTVQLADREVCIYVGETRYQYARFLCHKGSFAFDRVYLYECEEEALQACEAAVIRRLQPLFNRHNNPMHVRYNRILDIDYDAYHDHDSILRYLEKWDEYCTAGVYGFALPPAIYRVIRAQAQGHGVTVSEELTEILEALFASEIRPEAQVAAPENRRTNLIQTCAFAEKHGKSIEQVKQYLHQGDRLAGVKIGRDWVVVDDEKLPVDRRKKSTAIK